MAANVVSTSGGVDGAANTSRKRSTPRGPKARAKMSRTMGEFSKGTLHSGSKKGPKVSSRKQAVAIGLSQARKAQAGGY